MCLCVWRDSVSATLSSWLQIGGFWGRGGAAGVGRSFSRLGMSRRSLVIVVIGVISVFLANSVHGCRERKKIFGLMGACESTELKRESHKSYDPSGSCFYGTAVAISDNYLARSISSHANMGLY